MSFSPSEKNKVLANLKSITAELANMDERMLKLEASIDTHRKQIAKMVSAQNKAKEALDKLDTKTKADSE